MSLDLKESAVARSVKDALERFAQGKFEGALKDICGAIEGTLKKAGNGGGKNYKAWVASNLDLILAVGFPGLRTESLRIAYTHPDLPQSEPPQAPSLEEIIYHVVRCELYHCGGLPDNIKFSAGVIGGGHSDRPLQIPADFVLGLILAVLTSSENAADRIQGTPQIVCNGFPLALNLFWGKKQTLMDSLGFIRMATTPGFRWAYEGLNDA